MEQNLGFKTRFKYIEQMGLSIREMVVKKDPDAQECGRSECMVCLTKPGVCMRKGGIYKITCMTCKGQGKSVVYVGETGRSLWDRGVEHFNAIRRYNKESPMVEHHTDAHPDAPREFQMESLGFPKSSLMRQASEAHEIGKASKTSELMNRRGEWGQNLPPRLTLETEEDVLKPAKKRRAKTQEPQSSGPTDNFGAMPEESRTTLPNKKRKVQEKTELCPPEQVQDYARIQPENRSSELTQSSDQLVSSQAKISFFQEVKLEANKSPLAPTQKKVTSRSMLNLGKSGDLKVKQMLITSFKPEVIKGERESNSASDNVQNPSERDPSETEEEPVAQTSRA